MTQQEFLDALSSVSSRFNWSEKNNGLFGVMRRGNYKGRAFNPVTALAVACGVGVYSNTVKGTVNAGKKLGLTPSLVSAVLSASNRGHSQIIRGKLRRVLNENGSVVS